MQTGSKQLKKDSLLDKWLNREKAPKETAHSIEPRPEGVSIPLSLGQQRLLFLQQLYPENPFYNYSDAYRFKGDLKLDHFIQSFEIVAQKHEILRTTFQIKNGQAFQTVNENPNFEISRHDLRNLPAAERFEEAEKLAIRKARKSFDLSAGPLTRISILQLAEDDVLVVLTMHHIIFDKWSMGILLAELARNYQALSTGEPIDLSRSAIQYADYARWQNTQKTDAKNLSYWKKKLANSLEFLELSTDFPRPNRPTFRGAYSTQKFSANLSDKLRNLSRQTNTTLYILLLTAYKILLNRYTGQSDILVGSPFTNRDRVELENLIGFFNDTLVLRSLLSDNPTFIEILEQVRQTTLDAFAHKNMPFETLVKLLKPERFLNYNPLFQVMFIYHDTPKMPSFGEGLTLEQEPFDFGVTKFDLTLYISDEEEQISAIFEYSKDLFDEKTIERMHGHFQNLLEAIVADPNRRISELPLITRAELELFDQWNDTESEETEADSIIRLFEKQVRSNPENTAVSSQDENLTYGELNERANQVANYLLKLDLDRKIPVGLFVESSTEMIIGILGVLKAGLAYLPIDAEYPKERVDLILKDSSARVVLTQKHLLDAMTKSSVRVQTIEEISSAENSNEPSLPEAISEEDLAYVIYTSGSTGQPKGVSVTHKNLVSSTAARFEFYPNKPKSFLLLSSFSFDSSMVGIFWTLTTGGKLVLVQRRIEQDLPCLAEILASQEITHTLLLPTLYSLLLKNIPKEKFETLETVIVAGEACPGFLCREHFETLPEVKLYNEYGPTETTVWATVHEIKPEDSEGIVPIGKPVANTRVYILDENKNRVPVSIAGEMYIGGKGVTKGYFNDPELTENCFVPNPFNEAERLYQTGDLCRFRADGTIEFLGRKDRQIKLRGYRIEPGEIQETVKQMPFVQDAFIKLESVPKDAGENVKTETDTLLANLQKMSFAEADEILRSVEKLSDREIEFILNETERV